MQGEGMTLWDELIAYRCAILQGALAANFVGSEEDMLLWVEQTARAMVATRREYEKTIREANDA